MKKILIADDDVDILTLMEAMLSIHQFEVQTVSRWQNINSSVAKFEPDLILLDVSLGGADGRDICKTIKESEATQHIPLILFSANAEMGKNIEQYHAQAFIAKPFQLSNLLKTIGTHLV